MATAKAGPQELIAGLNEDLAAEFSAVIMYTTYAAQVDGIHRSELRQFFQAEVPDEQGHSQLLADKIAAMGGSPTTASRPVPGAASNKARLEAALEAEIDTIERYAKRIGQAEALGEIGLKVELENVLAEETKHRDELKLMLKNYRGD